MSDNFQSIQNGAVRFIFHDLADSPFRAIWLASIAVSDPDISIHNGQRVGFGQPSRGVANSDRSNSGADIALLSACATALKHVIIAAPATSVRSVDVGEVSERVSMCGLLINIKASYPARATGL